MKPLKKKMLCFLAVIAVMIISCKNNTVNDRSDSLLSTDSVNNERDFRRTLATHLNAVTNKNLDSLKSTMSPKGKMQLILPGSEIIKSVDSFIDFHREWFKDTTWTFKTKILNTEIGSKVGTAVTEILYEEPNREGKPYYNRMIVTYALEKVDGKWYIIQDHASSIEKSTDKKE